MSESSDYYRRQGVPEHVLNYDKRKEEALRVARSAQKEEDLGLFMIHVRKQRLAAIGLGVALGTVGGIINLITEPALTTGLIAFGTFPAAILGVSHLLFKNRVRVNDHIYDWSGNWNDDRRSREHAGEIAANSWKFDENPMWIEETRTDSRGRIEIVLGTPTGKVITHKIEHVRRSP